MPAEPTPGLEYRQEYYKGEAEDVAEVLSVDDTVQVPFGSFENCLKTRDTTPLEPDVREHKYYAKDVGPVLERDGPRAAGVRSSSPSRRSRGRTGATSPSGPVV